MSLLVTRKVGKKGKLGIWHISESPEELLKLKDFSKNDLVELISFSYEQRKKEWLAARILMEQLTGEKNVQIMYDEHSKPFLRNSESRVSLSHSHNLLAVILNESETGIDIEIIKPQVLRIKEKFMSASELNSLQKENLPEQLTTYWCAKESLYKLYGKKELSFKENLIIEPFQYSDTGIITGWIKKPNARDKFLLHYEKLNLGSDRYMLAYVIDQD